MPFDGTYIENGKPNLQKIKTVAEKKLKGSVIDATDAIGAILAENTDSKQIESDLRNIVRLANQEGFSYDQIVEFVKMVKIAVSYTWHPTNELNEEGTRLRLELLAAYELPEDIRDEAVRAAKENIWDSSDITPQQKDTMINEMDANVLIADRDNRGANITERLFEDIIEEEYGERPDLCLNVGGRSWGPDADGKNNNEGWALIAWNMTQKKAIFQQVLDSIEGNDDTDLIDLREKLNLVMQKIDDLYDKSREMVLALAERPVEEREQYYKDHYQELQNTKYDLRHLYDAVSSGDTEDRGHEFYKSTLETLNSVREHDESHIEVDEAYRTLRRNGFIFQKGQTRHNGIVYEQDIISSLFAYEPFLQSEFLSEEDRQLIINEGGFYELKPEVRQRIFMDVTKDTKDIETRRRLQELLENANPLEFDEKNGYPKSARAILDRLKIRAATKRNYAEGIISDAGKFSASEEHFLAKIYGMPDMKHMMLNEDKDTLSMQGKLAIIFNQHGGAEGGEFRHNNLDIVYRRGPDNEIRLMIPSSDSMRNGGPGTLLQMCNTIREATLAGIELGVPVEIMLGSGGSMGRFGCDQGMVRRIVAQTLQEYAIERGQPFDPENPKDKAALRMATVVMHTEQGRMPNLLSGTPGQIANRHLSRITEMLEDQMELIGLVDPGTFIDQRPYLKPAMREKADRRWKEMIEEFHDFRFVKTAAKEKTKTLKSIVGRFFDGINKHLKQGLSFKEKFNAASNAQENKLSYVLNSLARIVMCPNMRPYMNHGARPGAKGGGKELIDVRAIENDKAKAVAEVFDSSFYSSGMMMAELQRTANSNESSQDRNIIPQDIRDLMDQPDWNFFIFAKGVTEAMRFEATRKFEKLSYAGKWNFDRAVKIGRSVKLEKTNPDDKSSPCEMHYDDQWGTISEEEAYFAKIYYDRLQFLALTEATLKGELHRDLDNIINDFRPKDGSLEFGPGEETLKEWAVAKTVYDNHRKNDEALDLTHEIEDYFQHRLAEGAAKEDIVEELGGEARLREIASAWNAGTLAHVPFWTSEYNYGMENRQEARLKLVVDNGPLPPGSSPDTALEHAA